MAKSNRKRPFRNEIHSKSRKYSANNRGHWREIILSGDDSCVTLSGSSEREGEGIERERETSAEET